MKTYKMSKGWSIFIYLTSILLMIPSLCWFMTLPFLDGDFSPNATWFVIPISLIIIAFIFIGLIETYKGRLIITENEVKLISWNKTIELKISEVKGYTVDDNYLYVQPKDSTRKQIRITKYLGDYDEILDWVDQNFLDLDVEKAKVAREEMLNDETIGFSIEDRVQKLSKATNITKVINGAAILSVLWTIFYPRPYELAITIAIALPIIAIFVIKLSNGIIRMDDKKESAYPSVGAALMIPPFAILLRIIFDYHIFEYLNIWLPSIILTSILLLILFFRQKEIDFKKSGSIGSAVPIALIMFIYSCGVVIYYNCNYDKSESQLYKAKILNKGISSGRYSSYYLELSPWGPQKEIEEVDVGSNLYGRSAVGDSINVNFQNGQLHIPWFWVSD